MRLFLIRHGETVDNVAALYAGSRDSALTNTGVQQDFGFYEGKPFYARPRDSSKTGREAHYDVHKDEPGFVDVESKIALAVRCDTFLDDHLLPLFDHGDSLGTEHVVVVVSHGILLSNLWRRLLLRLPPRSVTVAPEILASKGQVVLEHLGGWSNTGFLELTIRTANRNHTPTISGEASANGMKNTQARTGPARMQHLLLATSDGKEDAASTGLLPASQSGEVGNVEVEPNDAKFPVQSDSLPAQKRLEGYITTIMTIDGKEHLTGFKRTRGGIGRAEHDEKQKTMDSFFKRAKKE